MNLRNSRIIRTAIFLGISLLAACGGGGGGSGNSQISAVLLQTIPLVNSWGLNGNGSFIADQYTGGAGFKAMLDIYQQDPVNPDLLLNLSSVYLGMSGLGYTLTDITVNNQWTTVTMAQGQVALVSMTAPNYTLAATLSIGTALDRAVATGNWLLVASNTNLALYDITSPATPVLKSTYTLGSSTTDMVALAKGFFVFTNNGFGYVNLSDPLNITFTETANIDIKQSKKAILIGNKLYIGGPSKYAGKSRIARIDVSTPGSPVVEIANDQINGTFVDFSYDSIDSYYLQTTDSIMEYKEINGALVLNRSASLPSSSGGGVSQMHAYNGRFYVGKWPDLLIYKLQ